MIINELTLFFSHGDAVASVLVFALNTLILHPQTTPILDSACIQTENCKYIHLYVISY